MTTIKDKCAYLNEREDDRPTYIENLLHWNKDARKTSNVLPNEPNFKNAIQVFIDHQKDIIKRIKGCETEVFKGPNIYPGSLYLSEGNTTVIDDPLAKSTGTITALLKCGLYHLYDHLIHTPGVKYDPDEDIRYLFAGIKLGYDHMPDSEKKLIRRIFFKLRETAKTDIGTKQWFKDFKDSLPILHAALDLGGEDGFRYYRYNSGREVLSLQAAVKGGYDGNVSGPLIKKLHKRGFFEIEKSGIDPRKIWDFHPPYIRPHGTGNGFIEGPILELGPKIDKLEDFLYGKGTKNNNTDYKKLFKTKGLTKTLSARNYVSRLTRKLKQKYATLKYKWNPKKEINKETLRTLKTKYHTRRAMNLPNAITLSKKLNIDYQRLKATLRNPKTLRATTKNKKAYETLRNTYRKNMKTAQTIYGKRSVKRKMWNRLKKKFATLIGRE